MSSTWRSFINLTIFGESHGPAIGMVLDGIEAGIEIDESVIREQLQRRAPGQSLTSRRKEKDHLEILSGLYHGKTTGTPITGIIRNENAKSEDYDVLDGWLRPSHADYPAWIKYHGFADQRGGGHFSGRLTAGLVAAGSIAEQAMGSHLDISVGSHIIQIGPYSEPSWNEKDLNNLLSYRQMKVPCLDPEQVSTIIQKVMDENDSIGGKLETVITGIPAGLGDPFFDSLESRLSQLLFSIPAVKGVSFGAGEQFAVLKGSQANDPYCLDQGMIHTRANHNGGILGGITNGEPIVFQTIIKPASSIGKPQMSVDLKTMEEKEKTIEGRHDPCILLRAVPVIEAAAMLAIYDAYQKAGRIS
ncbi:MAG: chorismate synthase [Firmicutes bacterium]|nr:chorismate synthase [Bacillota bacterium]